MAANDPVHQKTGHKYAGTTNKNNKSLVEVVVQDPDIGEWVKPNIGDKFYIDIDAIFPNIVFEIKTDLPGPYKWTWIISWDANVSSLREKPRGRKLKTFIETGTFEQLEKSWDAKLINKVIGGKLVVTVESGSTKFKRTVYVLGTQPSETKIKDYLIEKKCTALIKIVAHESLNKHFLNTDSEPVVAGDKGYGLCQLTHPEPSYEVIWSWKKNLNAGINLLKDKYSAAKSYLDTHGSTSYTQEMLDIETITRWNGGKYYVWIGSPPTWQRNQEILCDTQTSNIGWKITESKNKENTESKLHERDKAEYYKMSQGQSADHPWVYSGVCYADYLTK